MDVPGRADAELSAAAVPVAARPHPVFEQLARAFVAVGELYGTPGTVGGERPGLRYGGIGGPLAGFNRLMATRMTEATVEVDIEAAVAALERFPVVSAWIPGGVQPSDLAKRFARRGFVADPDEGSIPAMSAPLVDLPPFEIPPGVSWSLVEDASSLAEMVDVMRLGFGMPDDLAPFLVHVLRPPAEPVPALAAFLVRLDGAPVATSLGAVVDDVVAIYNVATVPEARGRGLGALATRLAMRHGAEHGARSAVLEASEMGYPLYRHLGFREIGRYQVLVRRREGAL